MTLYERAMKEPTSANVYALADLVGLTRGVVDNLIEARGITTVIEMLGRSERVRQAPDTTTTPRTPPVVAPPKDLAAVAGRQNGKGDAPKHRTPEWQRIDKAGASWRPRKTGQLAKIFGAFSPLPNYFSPAIQRAMTSPVLRAYLAMLGKADRDGAFTMPAGELAGILGCSTRNAWFPIRALLRANLIQVQYQGGREQATVYRLTPWDEIDQGGVIRALGQAKAERAESMNRRLRRARTSATS